MQNLYGGESIAIDPSNPRNVYFAGGMFDWWPGGPWDVIKSTDQGKTWERTNLNTVMHGNDGQINGERLITVAAFLHAIVARKHHQRIYPRGGG